MTLLAVERIKLLTTRSPWWCAAVTLAIVIGFAALVTATAGETMDVTVASTQWGYGFGLAVIAVLAALAITTEYRFSTIRTTFLAVPNRTSALLAKTTVVALAALIIGELAAFGAWGISALIDRDADLALSTAGEWTNVAGVGVVFALTAVMGVAVGTLIRHSAGAISLLLIYIYVVESLLPLIPRVGDDIYEWAPFVVADRFLTAGSPANTGVEGPPESASSLGAGWALAYFAGWAIVLLLISLGVAKKRDA